MVILSEIVFRCTRNALDNMLLIAGKPSSSPCSGNSHPCIQSDHVDDQRISLPASNRVAIERGIRVFGMRMPIHVDHANV